MSDLAEKMRAIFSGEARVVVSDAQKTQHRQGGEAMDGLHAGYTHQVQKSSILQCGYPVTPVTPQNVDRIDAISEKQPRRAMLSSGPVTLTSTSITLWDGCLPPAVYSEALTALWAACPARVDDRRWREARYDALEFLARWGDLAVALGWTGDDLFGLHPIVPMARVDVMGLLWSLRRRTVLSVTKTDASILLPATGTILKLRRKSCPL
jgi:hypothetical protein